MLDTIKRFFETNLSQQSAHESSESAHRVRLAVAALLIEVAESDYEEHPQERTAVTKAILDHFGLGAEETDALIKLAEAEHVESTDYFQFTRLINEHYSPQQKIKIVEDLWRVAFADGVLHDHEEHVIRRLTDLIHVPHKDFIAAKHRILKSK